MDAFLAAFLIPNLLINLFAESMNQALIPTLVRVRLQEGVERAQQLFAGSMLRLCALLVASMIAMAALAPVIFPLLASNFAAPKLAFSIRIFVVLLPVVLLAGLASNCTAVLNTLQRFSLPALAAGLIPLATIACALLLHAQLGIWAMVYGTLFGALAQAVLMAWMLRGTGYSFRLQWGSATDASREVARQYGPVLLSSLVASGGLLADQAMAAMLPAGSVSALVYAGRFVSVVVTLFAGALSSALTPHFSTLVARQDWAGCRESLRYWTRIAAFLSIPIALALILGAPLLIRLTLQHGVFTQRDTAVVAPVMAMYALQIPFFIVSRVHYRFILAMRRTDLILYCGLLNLALDIVLNLILMRAMGLMGIALATSLWTVATLIFLWFWSRKLLDAAENEKPGEAGLQHAKELPESM
jgi:putative peptidoglycan lipid II flippase